ncbi:MAG TPA: cation:proton antiporter [Solirubrobacterales bacterium]|nr:cation:proton antiporter [Solirubrobacterales bacterium]
MVDINVDTQSFLVIVAVAAVSAAIAGVLPRKVALPVVVLEILFGILIGPEVLDLAQPDEFTQFFSNLGLGMLFFFAGYEIEFNKIRGRPMALAGMGWGMSLVLAYAIAAVIIINDTDHDGLIFLGAAMATTAIGALIPILKDAGEMRTRFGTLLLAAGAAGEFGPILMVTELFSTKATLTSALILVAFVLLAIVASLVAVRSVGRTWNLIERTLETSGQLAIRTTVVIIFALVALATELGLDLLLGGFVAGVIVSLALRDREVEVLESKLNAVGYGFLIPFFFVFTGISFDIAAIFERWTLAVGVPLFALCFLVIRGLPALLLYSRELDLRNRVALGLFSATELPLVVAITTIAVERSEMSSGTAASLVGAAVLSTAVFPLLALRVRAGATKTIVE